MPRPCLERMIDWGKRMDKLLVALVVVCALIVAVPLSAAEPEHSHDGANSACAEGFTHAAGLGCARRAANGLMQVQLHNGTTLTTHGHDPFPQDGSQDQGETAAMSEVPEESEISAFSNLPTRNVLCRQDPVYRILAVYVFESGTENRRDAVGPALRTRIKEMNYKLNDESLRSSALDPKRADYGFQCNDAGTITVRAVETADTSFGGIVDRLTAVGFNDTKVKYLVFGDFTGGCGLGMLYNNDDRVVNNQNNIGNTYGLVYRPCWGYYSTAMHELSHTMGAVQDSAPHSSGAGHCIEGYDVMCYKDTPTTPYTATRCATVKFDCGFDDYFDTNPTASSYLGTHWNIGWSANRFIYIRP